MAKKNLSIQYCGARKKSNKEPCRNQAGFRTNHLGTGRCYLHGGRSTGPKNQKGNKNALKHGIYSRGIREHEKEVWEKIDPVSVEDELRILKLRLKRALEEEEQALETGDFLETEEMVVTSERTEGQTQANQGGVIRTTARRKRKQYGDVVLRIIGQINNTLKVYKLLQGEGEGQEPPSEEILKILSVSIDLSDFSEQELIALASAGIKLAEMKKESLE